MIHRMTNGRGQEFKTISLNVAITVFTTMFACIAFLSGRLYSEVSIANRLAALERDQAALRTNYQSHVQWSDVQAGKLQQTILDVQILKDRQGAHHPSDRPF